MALQYKLEGNILEVKETLMSFHDTRVSYWYYDIDKWLVSRFGKRGEAPVQPMDQSAIEWVKKHYLPKVGR